MKINRLVLSLLVVCLALAGRANAQSGYDLSWNTIDCGGEFSSDPGGFEVGGTIGQPDAGVPLTGSGYSLSGGFWLGGKVPTFCPADCDQDGYIVPADVACFINKWFASLNFNTLAADYDGNGIVNPSDVAAFVNDWFIAVSNGGC